MNNKSLSVGKLLSAYSFVAVFLVIFAAYALISGGLTLSAVMNILRHSAVIGIIATGMGLICIIGEIDLSVGSTLAMDAGFSVIVFNLTGSILITFLFAVLFGALCGALNGILAGVVEIPAFIVTLATMLIYRSLAQYICRHVDKELVGGGSAMYKLSDNHAAYQGFYNLGNGRLLAIPIVGIVLILVTVLLAYVTTSTKFGKKIYAIGSNTRGALMAGINVKLMKVTVFAVCGLLVGLGAFLWIAMNASVDPATTGVSYEMYGIAAVVLGGISMSGGRGRCAGIIFGAMSYTIIDKIIIVLRMDSLINNAIKGIILLAVILIQLIGPKIRNAA